MIIILILRGASSSWKVPLGKVVAEWAGGRLQAVYGGEEEKENSNCEQDYYATSMQKGAVEHDLLLNEYRGKVIAMGVEMKEFSLGGKSRFACGVAGLASACFRNGAGWRRGLQDLPEAA